MKDAQNSGKVAKFNMRNPVHFVALGFGSGLLKPAPGTWGTLVGVAIYIGLSSISLVSYLAIAIVAFLIGVWICDVTCRDSGVHDHGAIVWDEIVGYLITMAFVPFAWSSVLLGFVLFRLFDIVKPWPIRELDRRVGGGFGVMIDDVLAGIFAGAILFLVVYWGWL